MGRRSLRRRRRTHAGSGRRGRPGGWRPAVDVRRRRWAPRSGDVDVSVFNTQVPAAIGAPRSLHRPYVLSTDVTPRQLDQLAVEYDHRALPTGRGPLRWAKYRWNRYVFRRASARAPWSQWSRRWSTDRRLWRRRGADRGDPPGRRPRPMVTRAGHDGRAAATLVRWSGLPPQGRRRAARRRRQAAAGRCRGAHRLAQRAVPSPTRCRGVHGPHAQRRAPRRPVLGRATCSYCPAAPRRSGSQQWRRPASAAASSSRTSADLPNWFEMARPDGPSRRMTALRSRRSCSVSSTIATSRVASARPLVGGRSGSSTRAQRPAPVDLAASCGRVGRPPSRQVSETAVDKRVYGSVTSPSVSTTIRVAEATRSVRSSVGVHRAADDQAARRRAGAPPVLRRVCQ